MALSLRAASGANLTSTTPTSQAITLPTGATTNDAVYFVISVGAVISAPTQTAGTAGWTLRLTTNATGATSTIVGYKTLGVAEAAPTISWTTAGRVAWTAIAVQCAAGFRAVHQGFGTVTNTTTAATTHTPGTFAAGGLTVGSILLAGLRISATGATGVTNTAPTNWVEPTNGDQTTAITAGSRQQGAWLALRASDTGTVTPGAVTHSLSSYAIIEHATLVESSPATATGYLDYAQVIRTTSVASSTWTLAPALNTATTELLVAKCSSGSQNVTATGITSSPALTWTKRADSTVVASNADTSIWTAPAPAAGGVVTATVTFTNASTSTVVPTEVVLERWGGVSPSNTVDAGTGNTTGNDSILTTQDDAYITWVVADFNGVTGTVTYVASNTATAPPYQNAGNLSAYHGQRTATQSGWPYYPYGITAPITAAKFANAAIELDTRVKDDTVLAQASTGVLMTPLIGRLGYAPIGTSAIGTDPIGGGNAGDVASLTDDFATQDTAKWTYFGAAAATGGQLVEPCSNSYGNLITSALPYDLTGSGVIAQAVSRPAVGNGSTEMFLQVQTEPLSNAYALSLDITGSNLEAKKIVNQAQTSLLASTYSATNHAWLRIREAAGTIYFDTSPDGSSWSNFTSTAAPFRPDGVYVQLGTGYWGTETAPGNAVWDNLNLPPTGATNYSQTVTDVAGAADSVAASTSRTLTDAGGTADTLAQVLTAAQTVSDVAGAADTAAAVQTAARPTTDVAGAADTLAQASTAARPVTDVAGAADLMTQALTAAQAVTDAAGASDALATSTSRTLTDAAGTADTPAQVLTAAQTATDAAGAADSTAQAASYAPSLTDSAGAADGTTQVAPAARTVSDAAGAVDAVTAGQGYAVTITDAGGAADSTSQAQSWAQTLTDAADAADSVATAFTSPSVSTLTDAFITQDTAKWTYGPNATVTGGQLVLTPTLAYDGTITSVATYDLTGSGVVVELAGVPTSGAVESYLFIHPNTSGDGVLYDVSAGGISAYRQVGGGAWTQFGTGVSYDPVAHRWLRISEAGGTLYWDHSPDGVNWNSHTSWAYAWPVDHVHVTLETGYWDAPPSGTTIFDNVNLPPAGLTQSQTVTDAITTADLATQTLTAAQAVTDPAGVTDAVAAATTRALADAAGATDTLTQASIAAQAVTDAAGATDSTATATTRTLTDAAGTADVLAQASTAAQTVSDAAGAVDSVTGAIALGVTVTDPAGATDTLSQAATYAPAITDVAGASDTVAASGTGTVAITDVAGAADTLAQTSTAAQTVTDPAGAADTATAASSYARTITDAAGAVDSTASATTRELTDAAGATDTLAQVAPAVRTITDTADASDAVQFSGAGLVQITDAIGTVDSLTWSVPAARSITDPAEVGDSLATALTRTLTDAAGAADAVSGVQAFAATLTDAAGAADSISSATARTVTDPAGTADTIATAQAYAVAITDAAGATDSISAAVIGIRTITDAAGAVDSLSQTAATDAAQTITDPVGAADTVTQVAPAARTVTDAGDTSDTLAQVAPAVRAVSDTAGITDTVTAGVFVNRTITDVAGATDSTSRDIGVVVTITDAAGVDDSATQVAAAQRVLADAAAIVDSTEAALVLVRALTDAAGAADSVTAHAGELDWVTAARAPDDGITAARVHAGLVAERRDTGLRATQT